MSFRAGTHGKEMWPQCFGAGVAAIQYGPVQDVNLLKVSPQTQKELWKKLSSSSQKSSLRSFVFEMKPGDIIYAKKGPEIIGKGVIDLKEGSYKFVRDTPICDSRDCPWQHQRKIRWISDFRAVKFKLGAPQIFTIRELQADEVHQFEKETSENGPGPFSGAEELLDGQRYPEGASRRITVNAFERSAEARTMCIAKYGATCVVCDFDFAVAYGRLGEGYIHVHHLRDLASIGEEYEVDPNKDLRPVCPNCHAMLHRGATMLTIDELKKILRRRRRK